MKLFATIVCVGVAGYLLLTFYKAICYRSDYVSDDVTACYYFSGNSTTFLMLKGEPKAPECPLLYKLHSISYCENPRRLPTKTCELPPGY